MNTVLSVCIGILHNPSHLILCLASRPLTQLPQHEDWGGANPAGLWLLGSRSLCPCIAEHRGSQWIWWSPGRRCWSHSYRLLWEWLNIASSLLPEPYQPTDVRMTNPASPHCDMSDYLLGVGLRDRNRHHSRTFASKLLRLFFKVL